MIQSSTELPIQGILLHASIQNFKSLSMDNGLDKIQIIADKTTNCMRNEFSNENIEKISTPLVIEPSKENWMNDENQESEYFTADKSSPITEKSLTSPCSTKSLKDEILPIVRIIKEDKVSSL